MQLSKTRYFYPIVLAVALLLPNVLALFLADNLGTFPQHLLYAAIALLLFVWPAALLRARTFFLLQSPLLLFGAVEMVHLVIDHATTSLLFVYTCLISEPSEFKELMGTFWPLVVLVLLCWIGYFFLAIHRVRNEYLLPRRGRWWLGCGMALLVFAFVFEAHVNSPGKVLPTMQKVCPINMYYSLTRIAKIRCYIRSQHSQPAASLNIDVRHVPTETTVVLVLGETARYDHFGINGYARPTTPKLAQRSHLISFDSVYAVGNLTTVSVPLMLSSATPDSLQRYTHEPSIVDVFHEAGFRTAWIANQSFGNEFLLPISARCDICRYLHETDGVASNRDMLLLPYLQKILTDTCCTKNMVVMHSLGCHFKYNCRYPAEFRQYVPDEVESLSLQRKDNVRQCWTNAYDNAVLYTDCFLDSVITLLENSHRSCVFVYVSDHGENLFDDERNMFLHGTYSGSSYEYHVPLFVWTSDAYRLQHPSVEQTLAANKDKQISSMALFHSLLQFGSVSCVLADSTQSIASPALRSQQVVHGLDANLHSVALPLSR